MTQPKSLVHPSAYIVPILVLGLLMLLTGVATYLIEPGLINADSEWEPADIPPLPWWKILFAPVLCLGGPRGMQVSGLIICIILIGASFSLMNGSGAIPGLIERLALRFKSRKKLFLVICTVTFAVLGSTIGMMEEITPMILFFVPLSLKLGWDRLTGMAIPFAGAGCGFAAATLNPFTLGVAQAQAGIPLFSGLGLRVMLFVFCTILVTLFLVFYVRFLERSKLRSIHTQEKHLPDSKVEEQHRMPRLESVNHTLFAGALAIIVCVVSLRWFPELHIVAFPTIALVFVVTAFRLGHLQQCTFARCWRYFQQGIIDFSPALILILMAASVPYLLEEGMIKATILRKFTTSLGSENMPVEVVAIIMYFFQMLMNLFVPGGSSQALLTVPILVDLDPRISEQVVVLIFHCGDGFSNLIWPTNPLLMVALGLAGVRYKQWFRFILPLQLGLLVACILFIICAIRFGYGF